MKTTLVKQLFFSMILGSLLFSCSVFKDEEEENAPIDPVCGMKVNKNESFTLKHNGTEYYFDSFECRETFKMNPSRFISGSNVKTDSTTVKK